MILKANKEVSRKGYTLVEAVVSCFLASLLALLLAEAWATFARPAAEVEARARLEQEANLAAESLVRDLGGYYLGAVTGANDLGHGLFVDWQWPPDGSSLSLCFDDGGSPNGTADWPPPPGQDDIVKYFILPVDDQGNPAPRLVRLDEKTNTTVTVARFVTPTGFVVAPYPQGVDPPFTQIKISLTMVYRDFTATHELIAVRPQ